MNENPNPQEAIFLIVLYFGRSPANRRFRPYMKKREDKGWPSLPVGVPDLVPRFL